MTTKTKSERRINVINIEEIFNTELKSVVIQAVSETVVRWEELKSIEKSGTDSLSVRVLSSMFLFVADSSRGSKDRDKERKFCSLSLSYSIQRLA